MWRAIGELINGIIRWFTHTKRMETKIDLVLKRQDEMELRILRLEVLNAIGRKDAVTACALMKEYKEKNGNYYLDKVFNEFMKKWKKTK